MPHTSRRIKNWSRFQHYKSGKNSKRPEWIKLYRNLLDDIEWHELGGDEAKVLVMLWMLASENGGTLPPLKTIAFRLRVSEARILAILDKLPHWVEPVLGQSYTETRLEEEEEVEREEEKEGLASLAGFQEKFETWWKAYPRKEGKGEARGCYEIALRRVPDHVLLSGANKMAKLVAAGDIEPRFVPKPSNWLRHEKWSDEPSVSAKPKHEAILDSIVEKYSNAPSNSRGRLESSKDAVKLISKSEKGHNGRIRGEPSIDVYRTVDGWAEENGEPD